MGPLAPVSAGQIRRLKPQTTEMVAVAYADHSIAGCPPPERILARAAEQGFGRILIDTFDKRGGSAMQHMGFGRLSDFSAAAQRLGLWWARAGSIRLDDLGELRTNLGTHGNFPDCIGVRGAICKEKRTGVLCPQQLGQWQAKVNA